MFAKLKSTARWMLLVACGYVAGIHAVASGEDERKATDRSGAASALAPFALPAADQLEKAASLKLLDPKPAPPPSGERFLARLDEFSKANAAGEYDLVAAAESLKPGLDVAFKFVRDGISYESYPGVLRGPGVTFSARAGNAFDRSLLLALLLERQKIKTRFARGRLSPEQAEVLFDRIFNPTARLQGVSASGLAAQIDRPESLLARLNARARRDYAMVRSALGESMPTESSPSRKDVVEEIQDHIWVQAQVDGRWIDLDSSFADAEVGKALCPPKSVLDKLPREVFQFVTIRVVSERLDGDKLQRETAFELTWPTALLLEREILLVHVPGTASGLVGAIGDAALRAPWRPLLLIDGQPFFGKPVEFGATGGKAQRGQPLAGGLGGAFGKGGALASGSNFVAEWLELDIVTPPGKHELTRRALVDRAGLAWRQAAKPNADKLRPLLSDKQGYTATRTVHNLWLTAGMHDLSAYATAARALAATTAEAPDAKNPRSDARQKIRASLWPFTMQNAACTVLSDHVIVPALNDSPAVRFYADTPRILLMSLGADPDGKSPDSCLSIDLVRDKLRGIARDKNSAPGVVERKIWFGVLEGALEHEALPSYLADSAKSLRRLSTSGSLAKDGSGKDGSGKGGVVVLRPGDADQLASRLQDANSVAAATRALGEKRMLVMPNPDQGRAPASWWEVAADGTTYAVLADVAHGSRTYFPPTSIPIGSTGGGGAGRRIPGVVPRNPPDPFRGAHIPQPGGGPWPTDPGVEYAPGYGPGGRTGGTGGSGGSGKGGGTGRGGRGGAGEEGGGGATEYVGIVKDVSVPNAFAILEAYVDKFLVASSEMAGHVATVIDDFLSIFRP